MALIAIVCVVAGAVFLGLAQVYARKYSKGDWQNRTATLTTLQMFGAASLGFVTAYATGGPEITPGFWAAAITTGVLNIVIGFAKNRARALEEVALVTPIDSTTPAVVIVTSMIILGEYPSTVGWLGIWVMVAGTYVLNIQDVRGKLEERLARARGTGPVAKPIPYWKQQAMIWFAPFLALGRSAGVRWAFVAVAFSTVSLNYDAVAARTANVAFAIGVKLSIAGAGNLVVATARREFRGVRSEDFWRRLAVLGILYGASNVITEWAYRFAIVPYVGTMKRVSIPIAIVLAFLILGERKNIRSRLVGGTLMAIGAALIGLA